MKRILLILMLLCAPAYAAYDFTGVANQAVEMDDDAAMTLTGDFTLAGWWYWTDDDSSAAASVQYFFSWGVSGADPSFYAYVGESNRATKKSQMVWGVDDAEGDRVLLPWTDTTFSEATWYHLAFVHSGSASVLYVDGVADANSQADTGTFGTCDVANTLVIGWREGENVVNKFDGRLAYWAKWDRALSQSDITGLAGGCDPNGEGYITGLDWYLPMIDFADEQIGGITITEDGGAALIAYDGTAVAQCAAGGGVTIPVLLPLDKSSSKSNFKNGGKQ